ncbi:MAG: tripartite tricarboxylate transporter TctB family protein [Burkholderiales bacterium]|nr:MAG: tripartite tricarboxylate transporter TctB family protein [Burkholderiales bacterium]
MTQSSSAPSEGEPGPSAGSRSARRTDLASGLTLVAVALAVLLWLIPTQIHTGAGEYDLSPAFFPRLAAWTLLGLSVLLVLVRWLRPGPVQGTGAGFGAVGEFVAWSLLAALTMLGLNTIGFVPTAVALALAGAGLCGRRDWLRIGALTVAFVLLVDAAAWQIFTVDLP